jgi:Ni,Fe-hydrogenase III component G
MKAEQTINRIRGALADHLSGYEQKSENRVYIKIPPEVVIEAAQLMFEEIGARLQIATGQDTGQGIEVMYHWALDSEDCVVSVCVTVPYEAPQLESIADITPAAEWIEREMWELLGLEFHGHPDMRHLLLDDEWPEGNYPLRREEAIAAVGGGHARDSLSKDQKNRGHGPLPQGGTD